MAIREDLFKSERQTLRHLLRVLNFINTLASAS